MIAPCLLLLLALPGAADDAARVAEIPARDAPPAQATLVACALSRDGSRAYIADGAAVRRWSLVDPQPLAEVALATVSLACANDTVVVGTQDPWRTIVLDGETLAQRASWDGALATVSPDGALAAAISPGVHAIELRRTGDGTLARTLPHAAYASGFAWTPDGARLLASITGIESTAAAGAGETTDETVIHDEVVAFVVADGSSRTLPFARATSPELAMAGGLLCSDREPDGLAWYDVATGALVRSTPQHGPLAVAPDGSVVAAVDAQHRLCLIEAATGTVLATRDLGAEPQGIAFSGDGHRLIAIRADAHATVYDARALEAEGGR